MQKIGVRQIAFIGHNDIDDAWEQDETGQIVVEKGGDGIIAFSNIDQNTASLSETQTKDEQGIHYVTTLEFTVRVPSDISLAVRYSRRPVVVCVWTVDGGQYMIGTSSDPVHMVIGKNSYDGLRSRELSVSLSYKTMTGIL